MIALACPGRPTLPVGKIVAVGRNFADHAREMGHAAPDAEPLLFLKPSSALVPGGGLIELPEFSDEIDHEVELVVRIGRDGRRLDRAQAAAAIDAIAVGLDLTARDLQRRAKAAGDPWAVAKGFDQSAPLSALIALDDAARLAALAVELRVNGELRQQGATAAMITPVIDLVRFASHRFRLEAGDLIFTGTPAGVGRLRRGDRALATLRDVDAATGAAPCATLAIECR
ncbi:MAG: fumarylacetoacetate hydrolase family protein [Planctomycetes bacterium]|nr:fumarylacetoacetate hydrolase family protein [Planctomycetota bacterium]